MANIWPAESSTLDPTVGGFIVEFPSGIRKSVAWRSSAPILPTIDVAKQYVTTIVQTLIDERHMDDIERTNIASMVAAVQKIISDWNDRTRDRLFAEGLADMAKITQRAQTRQ